MYSKVSIVGNEEEPRATFVPRTTSRQLLKKKKKKKIKEGGKEKPTSRERYAQKRSDTHSLYDR